ncbi:MAG: peptidase M41 [Flavobacteriales bacterium]|jgi:ATP-dependent metalloprotease FtsH|nr:peptidase M41 [Flavobacteriales bacterium]|tara:strand:- start:53168 stop:55141 length:1974 start_codon:yes stop_codon:yes gene_type:complete
MKNKKEEPKGIKFNFYWIYAIIAVLFFGIQILNINTTSETSWQEFNRTMLQTKEVEKIVVVNRDIAQIYIKKDLLKRDKYKSVSKKSLGNSVNEGPHYFFQISSPDKLEEKLKEAQLNFQEEDKVEIKYTTQKDVIGDAFSWIFPILIMVAIWIFFMRRMGGGAGGAGGQIFNIGKSKATLFDKTKVNVSFKDVAGLEGAKEEVEEIVDFLKNPKKYTALGGKIPRGALLVGPPGTGKTLLAKAVAGEAQVPFFSLSGSDFVEMFVGVGASRVRDLFKQAKEKSPSIIFIDEIDAIGRARGKSNITGGNDERENTLNQLLTEMDGFGTNSGVIVIGATNRADILDRALLRAGRFDRQIFVDLPDLNERKEIFEVHVKPLTLAKDVDVDFLSKQTPGFSGADIANVCNESALIAARKNKKIVEKQDFLDAVDRIIGGLEKKNKIISEDEKRTVAFHEAGHATVSWFMQYASPLVKVTIVPRGRSLGAAWYLPEERQLTTTEQLRHEMCAALGGRAAEKIIFDKISTGALSDLEKVTKQAYSMVSVYGLSDKVGNISFYDSSGRESFSKPYSESTAKLIDDEVSKLVEDCYQETLKLLKKHKNKLTKLAELLLEKEVIFKEDLLDIFGPRPWDKKIEEKDESKEKKDEPKQVDNASNDK